MWVLEPRGVLRVTAVSAFPIICSPLRVSAMMLITFSEDINSHTPSEASTMQKGKSQVASSPTGGKLIERIVTLKDVGGER